MIERLFVYGTLAPGRPNERVLADVPGTWEPASVRGALVEHGWGAAVGFPAITLDAQGAVAGFLFTSASLVEQWNLLDEFEGEGYERVLTEVTRPNGEPVDAYIYVARAQADGPG